MTNKAIFRNMLENHLDFPPLYSIFAMFDDKSNTSFNLDLDNNYNLNIKFMKKTIFTMIMATVAMNINAQLVVDSKQ